MHPSECVSTISTKTSEISENFGSLLITGKRQVDHIAHQARARPETAVQGVAAGGQQGMAGVGLAEAAAQAQRARAKVAAAASPTVDRPPRVGESGGRLTDGQGQEKQCQDGYYATHVALTLKVF